MDTTQRFLQLKQRWMDAKGEERELADVEMQAFFDNLSEEEKALVRQAVDEDFHSLHRTAEEAEELITKISVRKQMEEVLPLLSVSALAKKYFGKSSSWFYQRLNGNKVHGTEASFTADELQALVSSLSDLSERLAAVSSSLRKNIQATART